MHASDKEARLKEIQHSIASGRYGEALAVLEPLLQAERDNAEALYMLAVCRRKQQNHGAALDTLSRLKALRPEHGRAHQEEGHNYREMGRFDDALAAYARASSLNPALLASWRAQEEICLGKGLKARAGQLRRRRERLEALPKVLLAATDLLAQGRLLKAEDLCRQFLQKFPDHVEGMRLLADIGARLGIYEDAEFLLQSALQFEPEHDEARIDYIQILRRRQKFAAAREQARRLLEKDPANPTFQSLYAVESMQTGDFDAALAYFDRILQKLPDDPVTLVSKGHALKTRGETENAVAAYRAVVRAHPTHGEAYHALANLKTYSFLPEEMERMQALDGNPNLSHMDRVYLYFALGKAFEDRREFDHSFAYYARGNALKKAQSRYSAKRMNEDLKAQQEACGAGLFASRAGSGHGAPDPIFIVGLPRAGSTLLEQILSSHSQVDGTLELPNILSLSQQLRRRKRRDGSRDYPYILHDLDADELRTFGERFIEDTRIHRQGAPLFIDKMPNNFRHIGLIKLILPNARIIDARRNPMACGFSVFKQLFAEGQEFSYSLEDIGRYYRDYAALMAHWDRVLPGFVLRVTNEDIIEDFETQVRRMLDFCGLPFEEACLNYHQTRRNVRTPSSEQVRRPVSREGVDQWRHYESYLAPLREALGPLAVAGAGEEAPDETVAVWEAS